VTRIVAGMAKGRRLTVPARGTRPTSDRVREALFSAVVSRMNLDGARVLDLYAGSGALGLEALSRGAADVLLVESDAHAAAVAKTNAATVGLPGCDVRRSSVAAALGGGADKQYDLVLMDPPYALEDAAVTQVLHDLFDAGWLADGALVVVERSARATPTSWPAELDCEVVRRYGEARVEIATCYGPSS